MRKVIRRRIRHTEDGLDIVADLNADIAINVGRSAPAPAREGEDEQLAAHPAPDDNDEEGDRT